MWLVAKALKSVRHGGEPQQYWSVVAARHSELAPLV